MKNGFLVLLAALFLATLPLSALGMSHEKSQMEHGSMKGMEHGSMKGMDHDKMMMDENMIMVGEQTEEGVKAMAHLKDVGEAMAEMGMKQTHHFMVMFMDTEHGKPIEEGLVAVKITTPSGETGKPVKLMGMQGHFGADVTLAEKGKYEFEVGTKVKDGKKRQYQFHYTVE